LNCNIEAKVEKTGIVKVKRERNEMRIKEVEKEGRK